MKRNHRGARVRPRAERLEARSLLSATAAYLGLSHADYAGPTSSIGPGGERNLEVRVSVPVDGQGRPASLDAAWVEGPGGMRWSVGDFSRSDAAIVVVPEPFQSGDARRSFDLFLSPTVQVVDPSTGVASLVTLPHRPAGASAGAPTASDLKVTVRTTAGDGSSTTSSWSADPNLVVSVADLDGQSLADAPPAAPPLNVTTVSASYVGQLADGRARIQLDGIPTGSTIDASSLLLSDVAGQYWTTGSTNGRWELGSSLSTSGVPNQAFLDFPPLRDESGSTMTAAFRFQGDPTQHVVDVAIPANSGMDLNRRDGGPINPQISTLVVQPTSPATPNMVQYVDGQGQSHVVDIQRLLDSNSPFPHIVLAPGPDGSVFTLDERLDIRRPMILSGASPDVTLNFTFSTAIQGAINFYSSHVTLDQFRIRFSQPSVNFTFNGWTDPGSVAILSNRQDNGQVPHLDLNILNLDIQAPYVPFGGNPGANGAVPTVHTFDSGPYASGVIRGNTIRGGTVALQGGPWTVDGNRVLGAVTGTVSDSAFSLYGAHDTTLTNNLVSNAAADLAPGAVDGPRTGAIDRFLTANNGSFRMIVSGNTIEGNVGLIPPNPGGFSQGNPRNSPEMMVFEGYGKWFEGSVAATAVSSSTQPGLDRRVVTIAADQLARFTPGAGPLILTILNGPAAGTTIPVVQFFGTAGAVNFVLGSSLPTGLFDFTIVPAHTGLAVTDNLIDLRGTVSTGVVLSNSILDATISRNTFLGDRSVEQDGLGNLIRNQAIRFEVFVKYDDPRYNGFLPIKADIDGNTIRDAVGGVAMYLERGFPASSGRTYGFVNFRDNAFSYSYQNNAIVTTGFPDSFAGIVSNRAIVHPDATRYADPTAIRINASGNTVRWVGVDAPASYTVLQSVTINGKLYGKAVAAAIDALVAPPAPDPTPDPGPGDPPPPVDTNPPPPTSEPPPPTTTPPGPPVPVEPPPTPTPPPVETPPPAIQPPPVVTPDPTPVPQPEPIRPPSTGPTIPLPTLPPSGLPDDPGSTAPVFVPPVTTITIPAPGDDGSSDNPAGPTPLPVTPAIIPWHGLWTRAIRNGSNQFVILSRLMGFRPIATPADAGVLTPAARRRRRRR